LSGANKVVNALGGCGPRPLLLDWFREDGLAVKTENMVSTIITMNLDSNYDVTTYCFS
jgi:hypothetical protein